MSKIYELLTAMEQELNRIKKSGTPKSHWSDLDKAIKQFKQTLGW